MPEPARTTLQVSGLQVARGKRVVLRDVGFEVPAGEILGVLGPNGAGKSTLLEAILGLLPSTGTIAVEGTALESLSLRERARRVAYVPQRSELRAGLSVREVVALGRFAYGRANPRDDAVAIDGALTSVELQPLASRMYPTLSAGEQQRVWLARALCTQAPVLVLDEPTAALDLRQTLRTFGMLRRLAADGRALVVVLHSIAHARRFTDRALVLHEGRVRGSGPSDTVLDAALVREVYGISMHEDGAPKFSIPEAEEGSV